jgi:hypothetical protein
VPVGEKVELFLGVDSGLQLERRPDKVNTEVVGFLSKSTVQVFREESDKDGR